MKEGVFEANCCIYSYRDPIDCPYDHDTSFEVGSDFMDVGFFEENGMVKMIVAFRGSDDHRDWIKNMMLRFDEEGFHDRFVRKYQQELSKGMSVVIVGHSRGGVLAQKFARMLAEMGRRPERVVTFGSPKVKDPETHHYTHVRYANGADGVVTLPPSLLFWKYGHRGRSVILNPQRRWRRWLRISGTLEDHFMADYKTALLER